MGLTQEKRFQNPLPIEAMASPKSRLSELLQSGPSLENSAGHAPALAVVLGPK
jgi:hypothetical protein